MKFLTIFGLSFISTIVFVFLVFNPFSKAPPALAEQIDMKTMSPINLHTYNYTKSISSGSSGFYGGSSGSWGSSSSFGGK